MGGRYIVEVEAHNEKEPLYVGTYDQLRKAHEAAMQEARKRWGDMVHILADDADLDLIASYKFGEEHSSKFQYPAVEAASAVTSWQ